MAVAISQVKISPNRTVLFKGEPENAQNIARASTLERSPQTDTLNGNPAGESKSHATAWLIGSGLALIAIGTYFLTRGKAGKNVVHQAAQTTGKKSSDVVENITETVTNTTEKIKTAADDAGQKAAETAQQVKTKAKEAVETAKVKIQETTVEVKEKVNQTAKKVKEKTEETVQDSKEFFRKTLKHDKDKNARVSPDDRLILPNTKSTTKTTDISEINSISEPPKPKHVIKKLDIAKKYSQENRNADSDVIDWAIIASELDYNCGKKASEIAGNLSDDISKVADDVFGGKPAKDVLSVTDDIVKKPNHDISESVDEFICFKHDISEPVDEFTSHNPDILKDVFDRPSFDIDLPDVDDITRIGESAGDAFDFLDGIF